MLLEGLIFLIVALFTGGMIGAFILYKVLDKKIITINEITDFFYEDEEFDE